MEPCAEAKWDGGTSNALKQPPVAAMQGLIEPRVSPDFAVASEYRAAGWPISAEVRCAWVKLCVVLSS
jgi:hypothetical protein